MVGKVYIINHQMEWIAILTESGSFSIAEVLGKPPELGDIVLGDLESLGGETLYNRTTNEKIDVFIQDIYVDRLEAMRQLNIHKNNKHQWEML